MKKLPKNIQRIAEDSYNAHKHLSSDDIDARRSVLKHGISVTDERIETLQHDLRRLQKQRLNALATVAGLEGVLSAR